jgi:hypothetical protein
MSIKQGQNFKMTNEEKAYKAHQQYGRISPVMLARKLQVTIDEGERLCITAWKRHTREWYQKRKDYELTGVCK